MSKQNYFDTQDYFRYNEDLTGCIFVTRSYNEYNEEVDMVIIGYSFSDYKNINTNFIEDMIEHSINFSFKDKTDLIESYVAFGHNKDDINKSGFFKYLKESLTEDRDLKINDINYILQLEFDRDENCKRDIITVANYVLELLDSLEKIVKRK